MALLEHRERRVSALLEVSAPERLLADLAALESIVDAGQPGWTRLALTHADVAGREWARAAMVAEGLEVRIDGAGNVIGRLAGRDPGAPAIMTGSHTDTVAGGGRFDGIVGVVAALEVVRTLRESGTTLHRDLLIVVFFSEEPNRFGLSCIGSRALMGDLSVEHLATTDARGDTFADQLVHAGVEASAALSAAIDTTSIAAFVELHIEQGPHLEAQGSDIGLVTSITGIRRFRAAFAGRRDHAGTTPMDHRRDAGCAAAGSVLAVERIASSHPDGRGTTGHVTFTPEAVNVVTERAELWGEFRSPDMMWLDQAARTFADAAAGESSTRGVELELEWLPSESPARMRSGLLDIVGETCDALGLRRSRLYSGAEHDAAIIAKRIPTVMIFVPSHDGRSHCPEEFTAASDISNGAAVLLNTVIRIDRSH